MRELKVHRSTVYIRGMNNYSRVTFVVDRGKASFDFRIKILITVERASISMLSQMSEC